MKFERGGERETELTKLKFANANAKKETAINLHIGNNDDDFN